LAALGANGPLLPFTSTSGCCGAARRTGLSCIMQHLFWLKRGVRKKHTFAAGTPMAALGF
jgi:hypothetical protein